MNSELRMIRSPDRYRIALEPSVVAPPGQVWNYSGGATELLGAVVRKATDRPLDEFAREVLFEPLGITDTAWHKYGDGSIPSGCNRLASAAA